MSYSGADAAAAIRVDAVAQAIKASGAIVRVDPDIFSALLSRAEKPLVVVATGGILRTSYQYLTAYKGFVFFTKSQTALYLPRGVEIIAARKIWVPG